MNIEEIEDDLEEIAKIKSEHLKALYKLKPENYTGCLPAEEFAVAQRDEIDRYREKLMAVHAKYFLRFMKRC
jgi:hypothetical protein